MEAALTGDEENFYRFCRIMLDDVPRQLRSEFKARFQKLFLFPWDDNRTSGEFFVANMGAPRTPRHIVDVIRHGNSEQFDSTVLLTCLLFSGTSILVPSPRRGTRTPPFLDSERIDDIRTFRNEIAHATSASLSRAVFNDKIQSLNTIYVQLSWNPTTMRQWATDPVVSAMTIQISQQLEVERQRYISLDGTIQVIAGRWSMYYSKWWWMFFFNWGTNTMRVARPVDGRSRRRIVTFEGIFVTSCQQLIIDYPYIVQALSYRLVIILR